MNKKTLGIVALGLGVMAISGGTVLAYRGDTTVKGPNYSVERHDAMTKAFENKDYSAWKNLMLGRGKVTQVINESNFSKFAEAHQLTLEGKTSEAQKIRQELGLGLQNGMGIKAGGMGRGLNR